MTRDWTKTLQPASFKGFPFYVETEANDGGGRRVVTHEYVRAEDHDTEDMGRRAQSFVVKAYLASDAADADREAFMSLLSSPGPGMLVLPLHGARLVNCTEVRTSSEKTKLGYVSIDLRFVEAKANASASVIQAFAQIASSGAGRLAGLIGPSLFATFAGDTIPSAAVARGAEIMLAAAQVAAEIEALAPVPSGVTTVDFDIRLIRSAMARGGDLPTLAAQIDVVAAFIHEHAAVADPIEMQSAGLQLATAVLGAVPATASFALANEQRIGKRIVQGLALLFVAEAGAAAASRTFTSRSQAKDSRDALVVAFDAAMAGAVDCSEAVIIAARESISAAIRYIDETAGDLAPLVKVELPRSLPSTLAAWALYRDPSRAPELVAAARTGTSLLMPTSFIAPAR